MHSVHVGHVEIFFKNAYPQLSGEGVPVPSKKTVDKTVWLGESVLSVSRDKAVCHSVHHALPGVLTSQGQSPPPQIS